MVRKVVLSVDAMGGDFAPHCVIEGISLFCNKNKNVHFLIYGDEGAVVPLLTKYRYISYDFIPTKDAIDSNEAPIKALKHGKQSSMRKAIDAVKDGIADACISSGNTGALMVMAKLVLGDMPGVSRPAIVGLMPTNNGKSVMLDIGANVEVDARSLQEFAYMGVCYAKIMLKKDNPSVALLNVGKEEIKGTAKLKEAYKMLKGSSLNFQGFIEGFDIVEGTVDVIVTDGFSGNLIIKSLEGCVSLILKKFKKVFSTNLLTKLAGLIIKPYLKKQLSAFRPEQVNGAMFIGINGVVIKSHGSAKAFDFVSALNVAYTLARKNINDEIATMMHQNCKEGSLVEKIKKRLGFTDR